MRFQLGGIYDGHELPKDINKFTAASATAMAGQGLVAVARDNYPRDGVTNSFVASFAEVEVDVETGQYHILDFLAYADVGTVIHPRACGGPDSLEPFDTRDWPRDWPKVGLRPALRPATGQATFYQYQTADDSGRARQHGMGHGRPSGPGNRPAGARCESANRRLAADVRAILNAISDAVGDEIFRRAPVTADVILASLHAGRPLQDGL